MNIRALKAKLATVLGQARGITDKAAAEGRDTLSAEEQSAFDGHMAASQQLRAQITNLEALADAEAGMGTALDLGQQAQVTGTKTNVADDPKRGFKSFGEYAKAVRAGAGGRPDERLLIGAAAPTTFSNESSGGDGGFAVKAGGDVVLQGGAITSTSPGCTRSISSGSLITRTGPAPIFWPIARPDASTVPVPLSLKRCCASPCFCCDFTVSGRACRMYSLPSRPSLPHSMSIGRP